MSKSDAFENDVVALIFNNTNAANIGDATGLRGSVTAGSLFLSLHTADPGEAGTQSTNEVTVAAYGQYARQAVARSSAGFTVAGNSVTLTANVDFPQMTSGTGGAVATHFGIGVASSGATRLLYKGPISPTITINNGTIPRLTTGTTITED